VTGPVELVSQDVMTVDPIPTTGPLVIACGALVRELRAVLEHSGLAELVDVEYLPAPMHNRPERIVPAIAARLADVPVDRPVVLGYADCGTGGLLDHYIAEAEHSIVRLPGDHCYEFFAGSDRFAELHETELGTFYLTDFLAKHFDALIWQGLGLDEHPELLPVYFGSYRRLVLLVQQPDVTVVDAAERAAERLGLELVVEHTGLGPFAQPVELAVRGGTG
jgi:hypothetical protein